MRNVNGLAAALCLMALSGCDPNAAGPTCTRPDVGAACASSVITVEEKGGSWVVTVPQTSRKVVPYTDHGHSCQYEILSCGTLWCTIGPTSTVTRDEAVSRCRFGR